MDLTILWRLVPAVAAAALVAWAAGRPARVRPAAAVDEVLRALVIGGVAARLAWLLLGGPLVWRRALSTIILLRAGVETWVGVAVAAVVVAAWTPEPRRTWLLAAAPPATLAALAVWHGLCGVEGVCAGRPATWGVTLPGYASRVVPVSWIEAAVAAGLAVAAWLMRARPARSVALAAAYAAARALLAFWRAPLVALPTRDQVLSAVAAVVLALVAHRLRGRSAVPVPEEPVPS